MMVCPTVTPHQQRPGRSAVSLPTPLAFEPRQALKPVTRTSRHLLALAWPSPPGGQPTPIQSLCGSGRMTYRALLVFIPVYYHWG